MVTMPPMPNSTAYVRNRRPMKNLKTKWRKLFLMLYLIAGISCCAISCYSYYERSLVEDYSEFFGTKHLPYTNYLFICGVITAVLTFYISSLMFKIPEDPFEACYVMAGFVLITIIFGTAVTEDILWRPTNATALNIQEGIAKYNTDQKTSFVIDKIQREFSCCGSNGYRDWQHINLDFYCEFNDDHLKCSVPASCCKSQSEIQDDICEVTQMYNSTMAENNVIVQNNTLDGCQSLVDQFFISSGHRLYILLIVLFVIQVSNLIGTFIIDCYRRGRLITGVREAGEEPLLSFHSLFVINRQVTSSLEMDTFRNGDSSLPVEELDVAATASFEMDTFENDDSNLPIEELHGEAKISLDIDTYGYVDSNLSVEGSTTRKQSSEATTALEMDTFGKSVSNLHVEKSDGEATTSVEMDNFGKGDSNLHVEESDAEETTSLEMDDFGNEDSSLHVEESGSEASFSLEMDSSEYDHLQGDKSTLAENSGIKSKFPVDDIDEIFVRARPSFFEICNY